ncbi:MAG: hypothetical protein WBP72_19285 [Rhodocyclaceae bacterium]
MTRFPPRAFTPLIAAAGIALLGGCAATTTPETDARLGLTLNTLRAQQTINPDASRNTDPVAGFDGKAAKGALDNYRDSFRKPPSEAASVMTIGVGQGSAGR